MKRQQVALGVASFSLVLAAVLLVQHGKPFASGSMLKVAKNETVTAMSSSKQAASGAQAASRHKVVESYGRLPLRFEANRGQTDPRVKFLSRGNGSTLFLTSTEAVLALRMAAAKPPEASGPLQRQRSALARETTASQLPGSRKSLVLRMKLVGASPAARIAGLNPLPGRSNYFTGRNPADWHTNIPQFAKVKYDEVYPGVDLVYYGNQRQLEYDFVVAPGADPRRIEIGVSGAEKVYVDAKGDLVLRAAGQEVRWRKPVLYQQVAGYRQEISGGYVEKATHVVGFAVGDYDASQPLIIDPVLSYSTYLGGTGRDSGLSIAVDGSGNAYLTGTTESINFPTASPFQASPGGVGDAFVTKLNSAGSALVYSTYFGGSGFDGGGGIAVDSGGNAYVAGTTSSANFPLMNAFQPGAPSNSIHAFVTKLNPAGSALVYSTYLGGSDADQGSAIAVDSSGNAYITGYTVSSNFPTANSLQSTPGGGTCTDGEFNFPCGDAFVAKLNVAGSVLVYSTYMGGSGDDSGIGIAVDASGNAYATGYTASSNFPLANSFQTGFGGGNDAFVARLNSAGSALVYSTYLGGSGFDGGSGIAVDSSGNAYLTGTTESINFPTASPFQASLAGQGDAFAAKLNSAGSALVYSSYLGGSGFDGGSGIAVDSSGNAYLTGTTVSTDFPTMSPVQIALGDGTCGDPPNTFPCLDAFVAKLNPMGGALVYSSYLGGGAEDWGSDIAVDSAGSVYLVGISRSPNFPTVNPLKSALENGPCDALNSDPCDDVFVAKIDTGDGSSLALGPASLAFAEQVLGTTSAPQTVTLTDAGNVPLTIAGIALTGDFAQTNNCPLSPTTLGAGASCPINVTFTPTAVGTSTGSLTIMSDAPGSPHVVPLAGSTGPPDFSLGSAPGSPSSATITAGQTATYMLSLAGSNGFSGMVSFTCSDNAPAATCSVSPSPVMVSGSTPATATVSVTTTAPHAFVFPGLQRPAPPPRPSFPVAMLWLLVALTLAMMLASLQGKAHARRPAWASLAGVVLLATLAFGCGSSSPPPPPPTTQSLGTPSGTYQVTVTATSGGTSHSMNLSLTVQ